MELAWVRWRDASHGLNEWDKDRMTLSELEEVGFILQEDKESITLGMENDISDPSSKQARLWLTIPKNGIIEIKRRELAKAFPPSRKRKTTKE